MADITDNQKHARDDILIWDFFQNDGKESFANSRGRLKYILSHIDLGLKVLNIGVGGAIFEELALAKGIDVHSLDPSEQTIEKLRDQVGLAEKARVGYSENIPFEDNMFDVVIMSEVLEHLTESEFDKSVMDVARVLRKRGTFIITVPFEENLLDNDVICPHCGEKFHRWGHKQSFSKNMLQRLLEERGFGVARIETRCFPDWSRRGIRNKIKSFLRYLMGRFGEGIAHPSIFLIANKNDL